MKQAKKFIVGDHEGADFSTEEINSLAYRIALWYSSPECGMDFEDPIGEARKKIQECLLGLNGKGEPWKNAPDDFVKRIKVKCNYDIAVEAGIPNRRNSKRIDNKNHGIAATEAAEELDETNPVAIQFDQAAYRTQLEQDTYQAFPELDNAAIRPHVESYSLLMAQRVVIDRELALGPKASKREALLKALETITKMADSQMKMLGIHPDQVRKAVSSRTSGTIAEFVASVSEDKEFKKREKIWARQLALQLWWMSEHRNGSEDGPQLSDFEIWHMTRSRPKRFTCEHGTTYTVLDGFTPDELHDFLVKEGVLIEEPVIPALIDKKDLKGLADHFKQTK